MEIFKIQKPLYNSEELIVESNEESFFQGILVYNEDRSIYQIMNFTTEAVDTVFGKNAYKVYVLAEIDENGVLQINSFVEEQDW